MKVFHVMSGSGAVGVVGVHWGVSWRRLVVVSSSVVTSRGPPRVRRVSEKISVSLFTSCVICPVWGSLSAVARCSDRLAASLKNHFMLVFYMRHLWALDLRARLYTSSH